MNETWTLVTTAGAQSSCVTRSDAVQLKQHEDGRWFADFGGPVETLSGHRFGVWGVGATPFDAVNDLSEALSETAQVLSRQGAIA